MAPSPDALLDQAVAASPLAAGYATAVERESALEMLGKQAQARTAEEKAAQVEAENARCVVAAAAAEKERLAAEKQAAKDAAAAQKAAEREPSGCREEGGERARDGRVGRQVQRLQVHARSAGTVLGREITRLIFGTSRRR